MDDVLESVKSGVVLGEVNVLGPPVEPGNRVRVVDPLWTTVSSETDSPSLWGATTEKVDHKHPVPRGP